jgi:hypothetical protein
MKRILIATTAGFLALSGAASAMTAGPLFEAQLQNYVSGVDVSALSERQVNALQQIMSSGDSAGEKYRSVRAIVNR